MKKLIRSVLVFSLLLVCCVLPLTAFTCSPSAEQRAIRDANDLRNIAWISNEPEMYFEIAGEISGLRYGYAIFNGQKIDAHFGLNPRNKSLTIGKVENGEHIGDILVGLVSYEDGKLTMEVSTDKLFNNKYKTIVFEKKDLPNDKIPSKD